MGGSEASRSPVPPALRVEGLGLALPDGAGGRVPVLDIPALALPPGGRLCLAGPSGAGKSTLLDLLAGLRRPDRGRVLWGETDPARLAGPARDRWRRRTLGLVPQDAQLLGELPPLGNVLLPATFGHVRVPEAVRRRARELLDRLAIPRRARAADLSRGERQRLALARALVLDPPVLLADEPTAGLDAAAAEAVGALLLAAVAGGRSLVVATHDAALAARIGSVLRLAHGRIAEGGA